MTELYLISGFLGAGKTTLLQKLLREGFAGQKVALVENDFGAVSLDAKLLKSGGYTVQELDRKSTRLNSSHPSSSRMPSSA